MTALVIVDTGMVGTEHAKEAVTSGRVLSDGEARTVAGWWACCGPAFAAVHEGKPTTRGALSRDIVMAWSEAQRIEATRELVKLRDWAEHKATEGVLL